MAPRQDNSQTAASAKTGSGRGTAQVARGAQGRGEQTGTVGPGLCLGTGFGMESRAGQQEQTLESLQDWTQAFLPQIADHRAVLGRQSWLSCGKK